MVGRKMYLTGGIGSIKQWEGFRIDYFLPQSTDEGGCYAETCAAIRVMFLAERILQLELDAKYADIMELCLYNAVLTGMSHDGKAFAYTNQLASSDGEPSERKERFQRACCRPNVSRLLGYLGGFVWTHKSNKPDEVELNVHLYSSASITVPIGDSQVTVRQVTELSSYGKIRFSVEAPSKIDLTVRLRLPDWASSWAPHPEIEGPVVEHGYLVLPPVWTRLHPHFTLEIPMKPRLIAPHPYRAQPVVAVAKGPLVYCVQDADNPWVDDHFKSVVFDPSTHLEEVKRTDIFGHESVIGIQAKDAVSFLQMPPDFDSPYSTPGYRLLPGRTETLSFVPHYARANRGRRGRMRVGLRVAPGTSIVNVDKGERATDMANPRV